MLTFPGVEVIAQIYESANSLVYRARRKADNRPVILKVLKENYPTPQELARYRTEYKFTKSLNLPGCIHADSLEPYQNTLVMSVEDFGGESLKIWMQEKQFSLEEFLEIAIATADSLGQIHSANIIHKDINPSNIVYNPSTGQLKIIDFGISTELKGENTPLKNLTILEGTLAYMSPEQTGRMNRSLDYRTDFYSLGVTFYELLTGRLPFNSNNALELVHCHIAKQPISPHEWNSDIPPALSDIVMKLLEKAAEDRYQSAWGIQADLVCCLMQLEANGEIEEIVPGERDICERLQISQKLYGREAEIETLLGAFERVLMQSELMLISGSSGIGKTALVQELYKILTLKQCCFISGKFDQYQRNIPYSAVVSAFQGLVKKLLCKSEVQLQGWRQKLLTALGNNGQVIVEVIPEMEVILGPQTPVIELGATEAQNRFNLVFQDFIKVFAQSDHPLVIFLDNLQWADSLSLSLIHLLMSCPTPGLFLIGAYRDHEVPKMHPLMLTIEEIAKTGANISRIYLPPLSLGSVTQLLADTLHCRPHQAHPLAELVRLKTGSNPFFIKEFIKSIYNYNFLHFDNSSLTWEWDLENIKAQGFTDNVVKMRAIKISRLPQETQEMLKTTTCISNQFELQMLVLMVKKLIRETENELYAAIRENLGVPLGNWVGIELAIAGKLPRSDSIEYNLVHERIDKSVFYLSCLILYYLFDCHSQALECVTLLKQDLNEVSGIIYVPLFLFFDSLVKLKNYESNIQSGYLVDAVINNQIKLKKWAKAAPVNFQHKYNLIKAEKARVLGQTLEAMDYYDRAIAGAKENGYIQEAALAYELAAKFYLSRDKLLIAKAYLQEAVYSYQLWGALPKVKDLQAKYPDLLPIAQSSNPNISSPVSTTGSHSDSALDMATIMKASEAISGEIVFHKLGSKLMNILRENIGAQKGYLIVDHQGELVIEAEGTEGDEEKTAIQSHPLQGFQKLPKSIVSYVARTRETVVLNDASQEGNFTNDPYIQTHQPKSILCAALMNQGKLTAIVYLENGLTSHAFTPDRLEVLQLLSGQAAIAIANAKLYGEVKERESRLTQFIDAMPIGVTVVDTAGQVTYANPISQKLSGLDTIIDLHYEKFSQVAQVYLAGTNQLYPTEKMPIVRSLAGEIVTVDDMEIHHSNKVFSIEVSSTPIVDKTGKIKYAVATFQDITQRKQAEKLLADYNRTLEQRVSDRTQELQREISERQRAEEAAQAANRAKSIFLSNMSHELRTPLNVILGFSQLMNGSSALSSEHQEFLGIITRSGEHLLGLINQVLDLSKIEAGRASLHETHFNLHRLLDDLKEMFQFQAESKGLQLLMERTAEVPQYVKTDEVKLRQVLINLINNALKFTQEGGVSVRVRVATNADYPSGSEPAALTPNETGLNPLNPLTLHFEIEDTGEGIDADEVTLLFQPFVQTQTGQNSQQGTGLGLTIAHSFVQLMGGEMAVSSQVGCGTLFKFKIQVHPVQSADRQLDPSRRRVVALEPNQPIYRLLIVDDRWDNRQLLLRLLYPFKFELYEAENGREAIEQWEEYSPHLIFMDMRMPVMDGYEATQRIKSTTKGQGTAIIALTASTFEEEKAIIVSTGCDDFIRKPFRQNQIFDVLQKHIRVQFVFETIPSDPTFPNLEQNRLTSQELGKLPHHFLTELETAIVNLDGDRMQTITKQITEYNRCLGTAVAFHLKQFQYELLLDLLSNLNLYEL